MATQRFYDGQPGPDIRRELNNFEATLDGTVAAAQDASTAATSASVKAQQWADAAPGVAVEPGKYSAKHWADRAQTTVTGGIIYRGSHSAASGAYPATPSLGDYYKISAAGTLGGVDYSVGDSIVYNGTGWDKIDSTDAVTSVAGRVGAVVLTKGDVGLNNVDNTSDADKPISNATQTALNGKANTTHTHAIADVTGLQAALDGKEPTIAAGTVTQYWRGDKTWRDFFTDVRAATLTGLSTATNAVITATDTVLSALGKLQKQVSDNLATLTSHTGNTSNPHGVTKVQVGLGNVDNTSDANKPVSTAQANAIALKADTSALATWQANPTGVQSLNNGPLGGMRNRIINGCFRVAQRPAAVLAKNTSVYGGADRFFSYVGGFTTVSGQTAQQTTSDLAFSSSGFDQFMTLTTTGTGNVNHGTRLESRDVFDLSGKTITVKVNVFQDIGNVPVYLKLSKANAKDDFSAVTPVAQSAGASIPVGGTGTVTLTTTLGAADAANGLQVEVLMLNVGAVTNKNFVIANFSLELGTVATPFEHRPYGMELDLARRYTRLYASAKSTSDLAYEMRATPTQTGSGPYTYSAEL